MPLIIWGFVLPGSSVRDIAVGGGVMAIAAGLLTAGIQAWQLRDQERA